jgi:hypothetical protein
VAAAPELDVLPEAGVVVTALADLRQEPDHRSELVSQLAFGETVQALERTADGRWLRVRGEDGYEGWLRVWALDARSAGETERWRGRAGFRVGVPWLWRRERGGPLPYGARLAKSGEGFDGPLGPLELARRDLRSIRPAPELGSGERARRPAIVRAARAFLGVPYLWGGRSAGGLDCSALTQLAYAAAGLALPRDAKDQCDALGGRGALVRPGRGTPGAGDLLFFATGERPVTHVALSTGGLELIHAYGEVSTGSVDPGSADHVPELARTWLGFARAPLSGVSRTPRQPG